MFAKHPKCTSFCLLLGLSCFQVLAVAGEEPAIPISELKVQCPEIRMAGGDWLSWKHLMMTPSGTGNSLRLIQLINQHLPAPTVALGTTPLIRQLYQLKEGDLDAIFGLFPIGERLIHYEFTDSYFLEPLFVYTHKKNSRKITTLDDLPSYKGVSVRGANYGRAVNQKIKDNPLQWTTVGKHIQAVEMVAAERVDFYIGSFVSEDLKDFNSQLIRGELPITYQEVGAAFSKKTACKSWIPYINLLIKNNLQSRMTHAL